MEKKKGPPKGDPFEIPKPNNKTDLTMFLPKHSDRKKLVYFVQNQILSQFL